MTKLWPIFLFTAACGVTDSKSLLTSGMSAEITISADGTGTTAVQAELFSGYPAQLIFVDLDGTDQLVATHASLNVELIKTQILTIVSYNATLPTDNAGDEFTVDLQRTVDAGAPMSTATMPEKLTLGTVPSSASRAADLTLTWSPSGTTDQMSWQINGDCINVASGSMADSGTFTIPANTVQKKMVQNQQTPDSCMVNVSVTRARQGSLDPHYGKGGNIVAEQIRSAMMTTMP